MNLKDNTVYTFKLNSGEEIVGKVKAQHLQYFDIEAPLSTAPTQQGMQLMPALFTTNLNSDIQLNKNSIAIVS